MKLKRIQAIDYLKGLLICCIVLIHANTYMHLQWEQNIIFAFFVQLAVPMFMVLSGFTFSISCSKYNSLADNYKAAVIIPKLFRFIAPVIVEEIIWAAARIVSGQKDGMFLELIRINCGPGSYYFLLIIELVLIFPLVYFSIVKWGAAAVGCLITVNLVFEVIATVTNLPSYFYARSIFAFSGFVAVGAYFYKKISAGDKINVVPVIIGVICSVVWICATTYKGYSPVVFTKNPIYALPVLGWVSFIVLLVLKIGVKYNASDNVIGKIFSKLGEASYHILCTQMVWFITLKWLIAHSPIKIIAHGWVMISLIASIVGGILFYYAESRCTGYILKKMRL